MKHGHNNLESSLGRASEPDKKQYESPQLRNYGSLAEITQNTMGGMRADSGNKGKSGS